MRKSPWVLMILSALVALSACNVFEGRERVVGTIAFYGDPIQLDTPSEAAQDQPFSVTVITYGDGCRDKGDAEVNVEGLRAEVTPYDYEIAPPPGVVCPLLLQMHEHTATLSFEEVGTAEIIFRGLEEAATGTREVSVTRTLTVR